MFGTLGGPELFLIFVVALIVFGPRKLPEIGKSLGKMMAEFRKASNDFRSTIESEVESEKIREAMRLEPPKVERAPIDPGYGVPAATLAATPEPGTPAAVAATPEAATAGAPPAGEKAPSEAPASPVPETVSRQPPPPPIEPR